MSILTVLSPITDCEQMDNEDIRQPIMELRRLLVENGFGWVIDEAEIGLHPTVALRTRALAFIDAAESVTVNLADMELRVLEVLEVEGFAFKPDEDDRVDGDTLVGQGDRDEGILGTDQLRGERRRGKLEQLAEQRFAFEVLRKRLDGDG